MRTAVLPLATAALIFSACTESTESTEVADPVAAKAEQVDADPDAGLKAAMAEVVMAFKASDAAKRRRACLALHPKMAKRLADSENSESPPPLVGTYRTHCAEAMETQRLVTAAAAPKVQIPLSPVLAQAFTRSVLKAKLKAARKMVKKGNDPAIACGQIGVMTEHLGKKKSKKTLKLVKKARAFCQGRAAVASARLRLKAAKAALTAHDSGAFSGHCAAAVQHLSVATRSKKQARLAEKAHGLCLEAYALHAPGASHKS